ncbi:MAG: M50 family metallopeptidase [Pseudomonadota bacterium]
MALIISAIPLIHYPFGWFETFFHELSHGLAALLTGGIIHSIELNLDGSGYCVTSGGVQFLVLISGYAGSALWGCLVYLSVTSGKARSANIIAAMLAALVTLTGVLWARDLVTILILLAIVGLFAAAYRYGSRQLTRRFVEFIGVYVVLDAIRSPFSLIDGQSLGDGSALTDMTYIPEIIWIMLWSLMAISCLVLLWIRSAPNEFT